MWLRTVTLFIALAQAAHADQSPFPYPVIEVAGAEAVEEWHRLRAQPGTPVILGGLEEYENLAETFSPEWAEYYPDSPEDILSMARDLTFPEALYAHRREEHDRMLTWLRENGHEDTARDLAEHAPDTVPEEMIGRIPLFYAPSQLPTGHMDWRTGLPHDRVFIAILPTENPWEAPAYLRWGGWNANPPPEIHVAALKDWHDRYGAVPIVMTSDVLELYAPTRPTEAGDAIALAREHFTYCEDIVLQGVGDIGTLAADRMRTAYWYFWWD